MNNYKNYDFFRKPVISTMLNSIAFNGRLKSAKLCLHEKERIFVNHKSSKEHHNKSYDYENNNQENEQKQKIQKKSAR